MCSYMVVGSLCGVRVERVKGMKGESRESFEVDKYSYIYSDI